MAQNKESAKSTREKAAEARAAAQAAERRRERMIRIVGGLAVLAVVVAIIAIGVVQSNKNSAGPSADSALPSGVSSEDDYGWRVNTAADAPDVQIYEDFQCPACANLEQTYGQLIQQLAGDGEIQLMYHPMTFLDNNLNSDHSVRAAGAFGCAIDAGAGEAYHNVIFANQPANEGDGWTDDQLKQFGEAAGVGGEAKGEFDQCVDDGTYQDWAELSNKAAFDRGITGTPSIYVDGEELPQDAFADAEAFTKALTASDQ